MTTDKIDNHYHQQLSALMDGNLPPDEARFLLRRLQHDDELTGCWERWQLCGDVLRGQAQAPAPAGFADRVAAAIAAEAVRAAVQANTARSSNRLAKWGGGALAASVAMVALFMVRQQIPDETPVATTASTTSPVRATASPSRSAGPALQAAAVTAASVAVASVPRQNTSPRRSATRTRSRCCSGGSGSAGDPCDSQHACQQQRGAAQSVLQRADQSTDSASVAAGGDPAIRRGKWCVHGWIFQRAPDAKLLSVRTTHGRDRADRSVGVRSARPVNQVGSPAVSHCQR